MNSPKTFCYQWSLTNRTNYQKERKKVFSHEVKDPFKIVSHFRIVTFMTKCVSAQKFLFVQSTIFSCVKTLSDINPPNTELKKEKKLYILHAYILKKKQTLLAIGPSNNHGARLITTYHGKVSSVMLDTSPSSLRIHINKLYVSSIYFIDCSLYYITINWKFNIHIQMKSFTFFIHYKRRFNSRDSRHYFYTSFRNFIGFSVKCHN